MSSFVECISTEEGLQRVAKVFRNEANCKKSTEAKETSSPALILIITTLIVEQGKHLLLTKLKHLLN